MNALSQSSTGSRRPVLRQIINSDIVQLGVCPLRSADIELLGEMPSTGYAEAPWLICFADSHYIQATKLLYHVLLFSDGQTPIRKIAEHVRDSTGIDVTPEDVAWLVDNRLIPSGLLASTTSIAATAESGSAPDDDGESAFDHEAYSLAGAAGAQKRVDVSDEAPILGIRFRFPLLPYRLTAPITSLLQHLYWPPAMIFFVIVALGVNISVILNPRLLSSISTVLFQPDMVLALIGIEFVSVLIHELGHASALARAKCRYGTIGLALYVIWPVLYTDVTHVYRLNRAQRIRVDLGGMYFQLISMIGMYIVFLATGADVLLLAIFFTFAAFLQQFTPFLRFDGYYTVADIMGVNEPLSLIIPFIRDRLPWRRHEPRLLPSMRRSAQIAFSGYLAAVVAFLVYPFAIGAFAGSTFVTDLAESGQFYWSQFVVAVDSGSPVSLISASLQLILWALIPLGLALFLGRIVLQLGTVLPRLVIYAARRIWRKITVAAA